MSLVALTVEKYKCFERRQTLELRPITVLLGRNNSGKSALARLPLLLETGLRTESEAPLERENLGIELAGDFTDLIFGQRPHGNVTFGLHFDAADIEATIQNVDEYQIQVVSEFRSSSRDGSFLNATWNLDDPRRPTWSSSTSVRDSIDVTFRGLIPWPPDLHLKRRSRMSAIPDEYPLIRYVGPFRDRPQRFYRLPSRAPAAVGVLGEDAPHILADDVSRGDGGLLAAVNDYLRRELPGWLLGVDRSSSLYSLVLTSGTDSTVRVNLADTGTGLAQVLPILVQRTMDELRPPKRSVLEIIEQPELHLHPAAHAALADLYIAGTAQKRCRFLIETHSETFVLRLRRRVAEGRIPSNQIALYYVEHDGSSADIRRIELDNLGNVQNWPTGIFSEDYAETRALAAAQIERT
ncbi:hypothetical protein FF36_00980 [Frankia torreyi]|uniref:AAA domain n=1 Tax=Frankia torreyi TaxID=1856 RepID=A0A0D8BKC8_9ACTN|nr:MULTISPECIES: DUF3696 domain-containing protein [Frankia]KJE24606.1 hypothetical protein FF36_00980 [Frankia torreyi]KQM07689.1 hypothetical protein FF86_1002177 [Frankia sp. CpI1-P]